MFSYLNGVISVVGAGQIAVDCAGVGFLVNTTAYTIARLHPGEKGRVYTTCSIREDAFDIYGFATRTELDAFRQLISVSGVGPKAALAILSTVSPDGLRAAVVTENEKALTAAPGVGKKLAQRILLELRDKISSADEIDLRTGETIPLRAGDNATQAAQALAALGYDSDVISAALRGIDTENQPLQDSIKQALHNIAGGSK